MHQLYLTFKTSMKEGRRAQALVGVAPVSYTHLDVYKRQILHQRSFLHTGA